MLSMWFQSMHCYIPAPTTESNTSTGMILVSLDMPSAANHQGIVSEFHIVWRVVTLCDLVVKVIEWNLESIPSETCE